MKKKWITCFFGCVAMLTMSAGTIYLACNTDSDPNTVKLAGCVLILLTALGTMFICSQQSKQ